MFPGTYICWLREKSPGVGEHIDEALDHLQHLVLLACEAVQLACKDWNIFPVQAKIGEYISTFPVHTLITYRNISPVQALIGEYAFTCVELHLLGIAKAFNLNTF